MQIAHYIYNLYCLREFSYRKKLRVYF